jgi:hypothetical protein
MAMLFKPVVSKNCRGVRRTVTAWCNGGEKNGDGVL